jgi:DNA replication protein DnaC
LRGGKTERLHLANSLAFYQLYGTSYLFVKKTLTGQWTYELFLNRAIAAEVEGRDRRAAERRMTAARLPTIKTLEAFDFAFQPDLSERLLWELADLSFVQTATNIVFLGPPGTGKPQPTIYPYGNDGACA